MQFVLKVLCQGPFLMLISNGNSSRRWDRALPLSQSVIARPTAPAPVWAPVSPAWAWLSCQAGVKSRQSETQCSLFWVLPVWKGWLFTKSFGSNREIAWSQQDSFVFWCHWCRHSFDSSEDFLPWWHFGKAKLQSNFFIKHFLAKQHFIFIFHEIFSL